MSRGCFFSPEIKTFKVENYKNFKQSARPSRILFSNDDGVWTDFGRQVFDPLSSAFAARIPVVEIAVDGRPCLFDFLSMSQLDLDTGAVNSIGWIDANGRCFFPRFLPGTSPIPPQCYLNSSSKDCSQDESRLSRKRPLVSDRKIVKKRALDHQELLKEKSDESPDVYPTIAASEVARWPDSMRLGKLEKSYKDVEEWFLAGVRGFDPSAVVTDVHKCAYTSPAGRARLSFFQARARVTKAIRGDANVKSGWFGASARTIADIVDHGFGAPNYRFIGRNSHGVAVHLSPRGFAYPSSLLSKPDENGERHIILCQVIMGNSEQVRMGVLQFHPSSALFDSGVDNLANPKWFLVWTTHMNTDILPQYIVSFKSSNQHPSVEKNGTSRSNSLVVPRAALSTKCPFQMLFAQIAESLSETQAKELEMQYKKFKEGKMGKEIFIKWLRTMVGDKLLLSAMRILQSNC